MLHGKHKMPMTEHGKGVMEKFTSRYGKKKGESVGYAKANKLGKRSKLYQLFHKGK